MTKLADDMEEESKPLTMAEKIERDKAVRAAKADAAEWKDRAEHLGQELEIAERRNEFIDSIKHEPPEDALKRLKPSGESTAVAIWSDWHTEETVDPKTVNGLNEYNLKIAKRRIDKMVERTMMMIEVARGLTTIRDLVVAAIGDFITGYIHAELEETNALSPTEATLLVTDLLIPNLRFLKREGKFRSIIVPTCYGNHGRTGEKKRISSGYANSYEWLMYEYCSRMMTDPKKDAGITWKVERGYHNWLDIQGHAVRFHHGDALNYGGGVGGITIPVNKAIAQWNKVRTADYDYFGHFHQSIYTNRWCCNGSVIGYGAYALAIKAENEVPSQTVSVISKKRGKIFTDRVFCD